MALSQCVRSSEEEIGLRTACSNVTAAQGLVTFGTKKVKSSEVVTFAERVLARVLSLDGEELGGDEFVAILKERRNEKRNSAH